LSVPTLAVISKHEIRCSICANPACAEVTDLLAIRAKRGSLADGTKVTMDYIQRVANESGWGRLSEKALTRHWSRHCEPVSQTAAVALRDSQLPAAELADILDGLDPKTATSRDVLQGVIRLGAAQLRRNPRVSVDQLLKALGLAEKAAVDEQQAVLMNALAGAISSSTQEAMKAGRPLQGGGYVPRPPEGDVVEAEVIAEEPPGGAGS
jgi:hypothetical protein